MQKQRELITTKELAHLTGLSTSFFEKGRVYGYGPTFIRIRGRILYRLQDVEEWLQVNRCNQSTQVVKNAVSVNVHKGVGGRNA
jgi:hypothetical protein